ncbi:helix-turn-helix domain-containing protein [Nocardia sp. NPDC046763]|uniref:helix-turn-helix domain-containing protein n=1 Tax=Nocardia sp. NPDC046763 TaxID=3155256 RepID=UPI0033D8007D
MTKIGFIGVGRLALALGGRLEKAGHTVAYADTKGGHERAVANASRPDESVSSIARMLGVSRSTIYKYVPEISTGRGQLGAGEA